MAGVHDEIACAREGVWACGAGGCRRDGVHAQGRVCVRAW